MTPRPPPAAGTDLGAGIDAAVAQGRLHQDAGDRAAAERAFLDAIGLVDEHESAVNVVSAWLRAQHAVGTLYRMQGRYGEAEARLREGIAAADTHLGPNAPDTVPLLNELGITFKYSGRFAEATDLYQRALSILENQHGTNHPAVASIYHNLGGLAHARGDFTAAEPLARRAVEIREHLLGLSHPTVAADRAALAPILDALGKHDEAERVLRQVLNAYIDSDDRYEIAVTLHNLAAIAYRRGDLAEAETQFRNAFTLKEQILGPDHPELATTLSNLGLIHQVNGDVPTARAFYERVITILEHTVEPTHPTLTTCRTKLVALDASTQKSTQASGQREGD